jgi:hypothetical protein
MTCVGVVAALEPELRAFSGGSLRGGTMQCLPHGLLMAVSDTGPEHAYRAAVAGRARGTEGMA